MIIEYSSIYIVYDYLVRLLYMNGEGSIADVVSVAAVNDQMKQMSFCVDN